MNPTSSTNAVQENLRQIQENCKNADERSANHSLQKNREVSEWGKSCSKTKLIAQIIVTGQTQEAKENVVKMNKSDLAKLFGIVESPGRNWETPKYVHVASRIYKAVSEEWIKPGWLVLNSYQRDAVEFAFFEKKGSKYAVILPFLPSSKEQNTIEELVVDLDIYNGQNQNEGPLVVSLDNLRKSFIEQMSNNYLAKSQFFIFGHPDGDFTCSISSIRLKQSTSEEKAHPGSIKGFGLVTEKTLVHFKANNENIVITRDQIDLNDAIYTFSVSLLEKRTPILRSPLPVALDIEDLAKSILEKIGNDSIVIGHKTKLPFDATRDLLIELSSAEWMHPEPGKKEECSDTNVIYKSTFKLSEKHNLFFEANKGEISFTKGTPVQAEELYFEISKLKNDNAKEDNTNWTWINALELARAIDTLPQPIVKKQNFKLKLSNGEILIRLKGGVPTPPRQVGTKQSIRSSWRFNKSSKYNFSVDPSVKAALITNDRKHELTQITLKLESCINPFGESKIEVTEEELINLAKKKLPEVIFIKQNFTISLSDGNQIKAAVQDVDYAGKKPIKYGILGKVTENTALKFINDSSDLTIFSKKEIAKDIDLKQILYENGLGGLDKQLNEIERSIILARGPLKKEYKSLGFEAERGLLLYGPPGTGKTRFAKILAKALGCEKERLITLSGPTILDKYLGESEKHVRELFAPAKQAASKFKDASPLYVILIDEIDGMLAKRSDDESNKCRDTVVNQFLAELDGFVSLNNLLVIGTTNRLDKIDPAMLRPGRLGLRVEVGIPDDKNREKIIEIYLKGLSEKLADDVDIKKIVKLTPQFTGAEIQGLVKRALDGCFDRVRNSEKQAGSQAESKICMQDFEEALQSLGKKEGNQAYKTMFS